MTSNTVPKSEKMVLIDICEEVEELPTTTEPNSDRVCVCRVPISLSSVKPEAFIPQFVGFGPYHHFRADLLMTRELKLGMVNRNLKLKDNIDEFHQRLQNTAFDVQPFYHEDMHSICDYPTMLYVFTVDGLFLLALLHSEVNDICQGPHTYFLTGKQGTMPLVNAAGVELTVDGIIREVFMIENQIPTHVLKQINKVRTDEIDELGPAMQKFCEALCPLVNVSNELPKIPEGHDHLLDLMYHLVAPPDPEPKSVSESESESQPQSFIHNFFQPIKSTLLYTVSSMSDLILSCLFLFILVVRLIWWLVFVLLRWVFPCLPRSQSTIWQSFINTLRSTVYLFVGIVTNGFDLLQPIMPIPTIFFTYCTKIIFSPQIKMISRELHQNWALRTALGENETIPSTATELHKASITFKPTDGGVSSVKIHEQSGSIYLPCIKLDPSSDVIIRNLLAYESLTKSSHLIFTKFAKLLTTLIHSANDVKLLIDKKIIQTRLSGEAVAQLFTGIRESINNETVEIQELEQKIKEGIKAKIELDRLKGKLVMELFFPIYIFLLISFIYPWILSVVTSVAASVYCMFHSTSRFCTPRQNLISM